jgi:transposase
MKNRYTKNGQNYVNPSPGAKRYKELYDHIWLLEKYWQERMSANEIADELDCSPKTVRDALKREKIPIRDKSLAGEYRWQNKSKHD